MTGQLLAALIFIGAAAIYVLVSFVRSLTGKKGCGSGCGRCARTHVEPERAGLISLQQVNERK
jgi:bacterioferritin-associated ferredoxin